jgi:hypothetical protein
LSDDNKNSLWLTGPAAVPVVRLNDIVAAGSWHVEVSFRKSVNLTGTTPRFALNTLELLTLIGDWTVAAYADSKMANGDNEVTSPQIIEFVVSNETVVSIQAPFSK